MTKFSLKINSAWIDTRNGKIRLVEKVAFGQVVYKLFVANSGWVEQVMPYSLFKNNIINENFVTFKGSIPKAIAEIV